MCFFRVFFPSSSLNFTIYKTAWGRSCAASLLRSTFAFAKALDEKKQLGAVFLDYSKAFSSVSFNCLLRELHGVGIRGNLLSWFRSYLSDRLHMTVIDGRASSLLPISSGVPQGSILGPLLFKIYSNSAPSVTDARPQLFKGWITLSTG